MKPLYYLLLGFLLGASAVLARDLIKQKRQHKFYIDLTEAFSDGNDFVEAIRPEGTVDTLKVITEKGHREYIDSLVTDEWL